MDSLHPIVKKIRARFPNPIAASDVKHKGHDASKCDDVEACTVGCYCIGGAVVMEMMGTTLKNAPYADRFPSPGRLVTAIGIITNQPGVTLFGSTVIVLSLNDHRDFEGAWVTLNELVSELVYRGQ